MESYLSKEVGHILNNKALSYPLNIAMSCARVLGSAKGEDLKVLDVHRHSSLAHYFVIGSAARPTQVRAMAHKVVAQMREHGQEVRSKEGLRASDWALVDLGDVLVHVFLDEGRRAYAFDDLWGQSHPVPVPAHYYGTRKEEGPQWERAEGLGGYF